MCSVCPYRFILFYSSLYFLLKHIILSYSEFNTVSRLCRSDPCSALHFPGAFINNAVLQFFASQSFTPWLPNSATHNTNKHRKKKKKRQKTSNVHPEQLSPSSNTNTFTKSSTHMDTDESSGVRTCPCWCNKMWKGGQRETEEEEHEVMRREGGGGISPLGLSNYL